MEYASADKAALPVFPVRRDDLFQYDVVIFGDVNPALLGSAALANLADFVVQKGGGLVMIAGPQLQSAANIATRRWRRWCPSTRPRRWRPIRANRSTTVSSSGRPRKGLNSPNMQLGDTPAETVQIWQSLPPVYWLLGRAAEGVGRSAGRASDAPRAGRPQVPVILQRRAGAGMVIFHATDETWRWRFQVGDVFFARYWMQTIRYLSRTKLLGKDQAARLSTNRKQYAQGEPVRLRLEFTDPRLVARRWAAMSPMLISRGDQAEQQLKLTRSPANHDVFEATFDPPAEGKRIVPWWSIRCCRASLRPISQSKCRRSNSSGRRWTRPSWKQPRPRPKAAFTAGTRPARCSTTCPPAGRCR